MSKHVKVKGDVVKVKAGRGYNLGVDLLCKMTDTGNGYVAKFPSYSNVYQVQYICMDYSQAADLRRALNAMHKAKRDLYPTNR